MKTYRGLFEKLINEDGIRQDILNASKGKRDEWYVKKRTGDLSGIDILSETTPEMDKTIADIKGMYLKGFSLSQKETKEINDGVKLKKRNIMRPSFFPEQIMTHGLVRVMQGIMTKGMYEFTCGSIPGRGPHYGKKHIEKWVNKSPENVKYVGKMDIKRFFESVSRRRLKKRLKAEVKDKRFLEILFKFLDVFINGLALGYYISQWLANYILQPLDHFIKQESLLDLKVEKERQYRARMERKGIKEYKIPKYPSGAVHYMRYMDDMVIFGGNKKELHLIVQRVNAYLIEHLGLRLKNNWQVFRFDYKKRDGKRYGRPLDFMGFKFYRDKTTLRKSIMIRATRKARRINKTGVNHHNASAMLSYMGWISHTKTYGMYLNWVKPKVSIQQLKRTISRYHKRRNKRVELAKGSLYPATAITRL